MKTLVLSFFVILFSIGVMAQSEDVKVINLNQTTGEFKQKSLELAPGKYIFEISNDDVQKDVGFWLRTTDSDTPLQNSDKAGLIKTGTSSKTGVVTLTKGEYIYSCPLNPTPNYKVTVK